MAVGLAAVMVTTAGAVPEQAPPQPEKVDPDAGVAVEGDGGAVGVGLALQVLPQVIPTGEEETVPVPLPALVTVRGVVDGGEGERRRDGLRSGHAHRAGARPGAGPAPAGEGGARCAGGRQGDGGACRGMLALQVAPQLMPAGAGRDRAGAGARPRDGEGVGDGGEGERRRDGLARRSC